MLVDVPEFPASDVRRRVWAAVGVHPDELSSTVLCVGLPGDAESTTGRMLRSAAAAGEPVVLTLRRLRRHERAMRCEGQVRVCENPMVIAAAADDLGPGCPPLVCVHGRPSAAAWRLLELLRSGGARFAYHGDFDWGGVGIASAVYERIGWTPWRYGAADCLAAPGMAELSGKPSETPWDSALSATMLQRGIRVEEELVLGDLLADLRSGR